MPTHMFFRLGPLASLLGLAVLTGCASPPAPAPTPAPAPVGVSLKDCDQRPAGDGLSFQCETVDGSIHDSTVPVAEALHTYVEDVKKSYANKGQVEGTLLGEGADRVPGRGTMRVRIQWNNRPEQPVAEGYVFGFERPGGGTRVASCIAADGGKAPWELCNALLRTAPELPDPKALLGQPVSVPEGCEPQRIRGGAYGIACEDAQLSWMRVNGAFDPATPERLTHGLRKMATAVLEDTPVKCRVRGRDAACHRLVMDSGEGRQSVLISAVGEAKHMMVVTCLWKSGPMPAMCTDILAVEDVSAPR